MVQTRPWGDAWPAATLGNGLANVRHLIVEDDGDETQMWRPLALDRQSMHVSMSARARAGLE